MSIADPIQYCRDLLFKNRKIICTGNPNKNTIAKGIKQIWPDSTFIHLSNGWDLANLSEDTQHRLADLFTQHTTFINASYIAPGTQKQLLELCNTSTKYYEVFNIGSTHEFDQLGSEVYTQSKQDLQKTSLELNTFRFQTTHIMLGGIDKQRENDKDTFLSVVEIAETIQWIIKQRFKVPLMCIDQPKQSW